MAESLQAETTTFYIAEDFPNAIISKRRQLYPIYKAAKNLPMYQRKVSMLVELVDRANPNVNYNILSSVLEQAKNRHLPKKSNVLIVVGTALSHG